MEECNRKQKAGETCIVVILIMCTLLQILFGLMKTLRMKRLGYVSCMGKVISACRIVFGEAKWKLLLWRPGHRWEGKNNVNF